MATFYKLRGYEIGKERLLGRVNEQKVNAEEVRRLEYNAAVQIQSWYRKLRVIAYLKLVFNLVNLLLVTTIFIE